MAVAGCRDENEFSSRWCLCAWKSPYAFHPVSQTFSPNVAFETVPMYSWLTMALSRPLKEDRLVLPLGASDVRQSIAWQLDRADAGRAPPPPPTPHSPLPPPPPTPWPPPTTRHTNLPLPPPEKKSEHLCDWLVYIKHADDRALR